MEQNNFESLENQKLPNATAVLVLGIMSIVTCCCYGILSVILGGIGLYLAKKDTQVYSENPTAYSNFKNVSTGKILCIIGIILGAIYLIMMVAFYAMFGMESMSDPAIMQEKMRELMGQ